MAGKPFVDMRGTPPPKRRETVRLPSVLWSKAIARVRAGSTCSSPERGASLFHASFAGEIRLRFTPDSVAKDARILAIGYLPIIDSR
jgi:hypothetical protein